MRETKFRAWDNQNNIMIGPFEVGSELSMSWPPEMQYTGLKDKNGKEIYEGDIVRFETRIGEVFFKTNGSIDYCFKVYKAGNFGLNSNDIGFYEIIGNIHKNKELLNE